MENTMAVAIGPLPTSRRWIVAYWVLTAFIACNQVAAGGLDIMHAKPFYPLLLHLGYPSYFSTLLGVWKLLGAIALLAPRWPLLKEWAYAGLFFDFSSAIVSHAAAGDDLAALIGPLLSIVALAASWYLRPQSRRLDGTFRMT
jgi:hypothetical protein